MTRLILILAFFCFSLHDSNLTSFVCTINEHSTGKSPAVTLHDGYIVFDVPSIFASLFKAGEDEVPLRRLRSFVSKECGLNVIHQRVNGPNDKGTRSFLPLEEVRGKDIRRARPVEADFAAAMDLLDDVDCLLAAFRVIYPHHCSESNAQSLMFSTVESKVCLFPVSLHRTFPLSLYISRI